MSNLREAAQQALADICAARLCEVNSMSSRQEMLRLMIQAIETLRAALEQPEQEPGGVCARCGGWVCDPVLKLEQPEQEDEMQKMLRSLGFDDQCPESIGITLRRWKDGYAAALEQPEQEPVAWMHKGTLGFSFSEKQKDVSSIPLYCAPMTMDSDFIQIPVAYQYAYPDGEWRCSYGDPINGSTPVTSRALYARKDGK